jgi:hypothetical protein
MSFACARADTLLVSLDTMMLSRAYAYWYYYAPSTGRGYRRTRM